ncbi:single-stranded-DNA-specific exonuclease RecJ [Alphaproteobacteria bacterium]|nr:single-stranded-DNA-specific exonuclease RecJ [Alphaproteobacteria bacterium]
MEFTSCLGMRWRQKACDHAEADAIARRYGVPDLLARVMAARGVSESTAESYLDPRLARDLPDPSGLRDMAKAASRIAAAVVRGEHIYIYGDYDVDGATSSSVLYLFLKAVGAKEVSVRIPERNEGYDADSVSMRQAKEAGVGLVITVDCGTTAFEALDTARQLRLDVVILDHHEPTEKLPPAVAVVNPKRLDEDREGVFRHLAAVGVAFMTCIAVSRELRGFGWYQQRAEPDLRRYLDLVALGTVCDVVRLSGVNRLLVRAGTAVAGASPNTGIKVVSDLLKIKPPLLPYHFGFVIGPRINAGGRVGESSLGFRLLTAPDAGAALRVAEELDALNVKRRQIEHEVMLQASAQLAASATDGATFIMVHGEGWQKGVIGIVAGRLREKHNLPALVLSVEDGQAKGSGRSVDGINLGRIVMDAAVEGVIMEGGGHAMAAGFTLDAAKIEDFRAYVAAHILRQLAGEAMPCQSEYDALVGPAAMTVRLAKALSALEPYGAGNEEPMFALAEVQPVRASVVGQGHVRCILKGAGGSVQAIAFKHADTEVGRALMDARGGQLTVLGRLKVNEYQGRESASFQVADAARI